jgi:hypothetical protein
MKRKLSVVIPIVVAVFLFAFSSLALASNAQTSNSSLPNVAAAHYPTASGPLVAHSTKGLVNPTSNRPCPTTASCGVIADNIGGVQVTMGSKILASVFVPSSLTPSTCPEGAVTLDPTDVLITDPCGNSGLGAAWDFNPQTLTFATTGWTNIGSEPVFGTVIGSDVYFVNFGYSTLTEVTTTDSFVATIPTCGYYPEFMAVAGGKLYVSNQEGYDSSTGNYAGCIDQVSGSAVMHTLWGDASNGPGADITITGLGFAGGNLYVNAPYYFNSYSTYGASFEFKISGWNSAGPIAFPSSTAGTYALWGMISSGKSVYPLSPYTYNSTSGLASTLGFVYSITGTTVGSAISTGIGMNFECGSGHSFMMPLYYGGESLGDGLYTLLNTKTGTAQNYGTNYGLTEGSGCAFS